MMGEQVQQRRVNYIGAGLFTQSHIDVATPRGIGMPTVSQQSCEVKVDGAWHAATLAEARSRYTMAQKRCPACQGQIIVAGNYFGEGSFKLQHRRSHTGCPLKPDTYTGSPVPHPEALI